MHKKIIFFIVLATSMVIWMVSCTKESADKLEGSNNTCDTTNVSYNTGVVPILQANCYSCHGTGNTGGSGGILTAMCQCPMMRQCFLHAK